MSSLKRRESSSSQARGSGAFVATAADLGRWASFLEFVSAGQWPDGQKRVPGSIVLFVEDGKLKACVSDKDQGLVAFVTAESVLGLLEAVENGLREDRLDWRMSRASRPSPRR